MGAPSRTYFCKNGHITDGYGHHELGPDDEGKGPCPQCGSNDILCVLEWQDEEYWEDGKPIVPLQPVSYIEKVVTIQVPVFDVSNLFKIKKV